MSKLYWVQPDEAIPAETAAELVTKLTNSSMMPVENEQAFRERAAMWCKELYNATVRTETDEVFVEDMIACGAYRVEEMN
jgi:hypothetical protein